MLEAVTAGDGGAADVLARQRITQPAAMMINRLRSEMTTTAESTYLQQDEPTLRQVAQMTGGEYHHAATAEALRSVCQNLGSRLQMRQRDTELTALLALAAAIVLMAGAGLSVLWFGRVS